MFGARTLEDPVGCLLLLVRLGFGVAFGGITAVDLTTAADLKVKLLNLVDAVGTSSLGRGWLGRGSPSVHHLVHGSEARA